MGADMSIELLSNIEKLHTTELGVGRIKHNLNLDAEDVVKWCKEKCILADDILRKGKNWYVHVSDCIITINAHSYTIITAHKKKSAAMTSKRVLDLYNRLGEHGINIWIDGGWGIDALLGIQTREHVDLDIAVRREDNAALRKLLEDDGYFEEKRFDSTEFMYVMKNSAGECVDVHVFEYDEKGGNVYGIEYPYGSLTGTGIIGGQTVNCIDPEFMFRFKTGYEPKEKDVHDVRALAVKFGFNLPSRFMSEHS
jgi:lincosamide nucleotidyltransferase A/C/D/E